MPPHGGEAEISLLFDRHNRRVASRLGEIIDEAAENATRIERDASGRAKEIIAEAKREAEKLNEEAELAATRLRSDAERHAAELRHGAELDAARLIEQAEQRRDAIEVEVEAIDARRKNVLGGIGAIARGLDDVVLDARKADASDAPGETAEGPETA